jgi:hypothetical protein
MPIGPARLAALLASVLVAAPALAQPPSMDALWPNADGRSWTYAQHYENLEGGEPQVVDNRTRIFFDGMVVAPVGIDAQYLRQVLVSGPAPAIALEAKLSDPLLRQVWVARPDLREKISAAVDLAPCPQFHPAGAYAILLNGEFAYRKTADEIAAWRCNLANTRSWLWLISDVSIGKTFTLQLIPDLSDNVFLHGMVAAIEPVTVPAGSFENAVRVDYVIDYGMSFCVDEPGNTTGTNRSETRGYVHYVPDVGPVDSFEEFIPYAELNGTCGSGQVGQPSSRITMSLESQPTAARPASWGKLKLLYR